MLRALLALCLVAPALSAQDPALEPLRASGQWRQVRARVTPWFQAKPEDPYAQLWMARVRMAFHDPEGALDLARKAAAKRPADPVFQAQLGMAAGNLAGQTDGKMKQFSLAREMKKALEAALAADPTQDEPAQFLLQFYLQAPGIIGGGEDKAKDLAQRVTAVRPVDGLLLHAAVAMHAKDLTTAQGYIGQALAKDPRSADPHLAMVRVHLLQKPQALDAAVGSLRAALALKPASLQAHAQLATILAEQGKWSELEAALAQARKAVPHSLQPYYAAGRNLVAERKHLERAEGLLKTFLGQEAEGGAPDHAAAHWRLGQLYTQLGRTADAVRELEAAVTLRPTLTQAQKDLDKVRKG